VGVLSFCGRYCSIAWGFVTGNGGLGRKGVAEANLMLLLRRFAIGRPASALKIRRVDRETRWR
jgi:hypothetical protein